MNLRFLFFSTTSSSLLLLLLSLLSSSSELELGLLSFLFLFLFLLIRISSILTPRSNHKLYQVSTTLRSSDKPGGGLTLATKYLVPSRQSHHVRSGNVLIAGPRPLWRLQKLESFNVHPSLVLGIHHPSSPLPPPPPPPPPPALQGSGNQTNPVSPSPRPSPMSSFCLITYSMQKRREKSL